MSKNNNTANKKAKKEMNNNWKKEFDEVRQFLLNASFPPEHPGLLAALNGIDQEMKRRERDSKLHQKFSTSTTRTTTSAVELDDCDDAVKVEKPSIDVTNNITNESMKTSETKEEASMMVDDWQDVASDEGGTDTSFGKRSTEDDDSSSYLGQVLAKKAVEAIAFHKVKCTYPVSAIAVALHAALLQTGFSCTGIPENKPSNGFAAPIRKLPEGQFLPDQWEKTNEIKLRYRKDGIAATILSVTAENDKQEINIRVLLAPSTAKETTNAMSVREADHINLDSWNRARSKDSSAISPTLHYKKLTTLMTKFAQHFDLGPVENEQMDDNNNNNNKEGIRCNSSSKLPYVDYTLLQSQQQRNHVGGGEFARSQSDTTFPSHPTNSDPVGVYVGVGGGNNNNFRPQLPVGGDFNGDLTPSGINPFPGGLPSNPGNLMGPNHPSFFVGGGRGIASPPTNPGGLGMHPRFDPFGPPGGPTEPDDPDRILQQQQGPKRDVRFPGGSGNPNNDLAKPPSFSNNNMFL